jgi:hypothetical protein
MVTRARLPALAPLWRSETASVFWAGRVSLPHLTAQPCRGACVTAPARPVRTCDGRASDGHHLLISTSSEMATRVSCSVQCNTVATYSPTSSHVGRRGVVRAPTGVTGELPRSVGAARERAAGATHGRRWQCSVNRATHTERRAARAAGMDPPGVADHTAVRTTGMDSEAQLEAFWAVRIVRGPCP